MLGIQSFVLQGARPLLSLAISLGCGFWLLPDLGHAAPSQREENSVRSLAKGADRQDALLPPPNRSQLRTLLKAGRYGELEHILDQYLVAAQWSLPDGESPLIQAYRAFNVSDAESMARLDEWIERSPTAYQAYTARAYSRIDAGLNARGTAFMKDTRREQVELMNRLLGLAAEDCRQAMLLQPDSPAPSRGLVIIAGMAGAKGVVEVATEALKAFPTSFNIRVNALVKLQPRWGGSYELMEAFADAAQAFAGQNPKLKTLRGYPLWARGQDAYSDERYEEAYALYTQALIHGAEPDFYSARSAASRKLKRFAEAFEDARQAQALSPWQDGDDPDDNLLARTTRVAWTHARESFQAGKFTQAIAIYSALLGNNPEDSEAWTWRGSALCRIGDADAGLRDLTQAAQLNSKSRTVVAETVNCLMDSRRDKDAIKVVRRYQKEVPDDGVSFYMLAVLFGRTNDAEAAVVALKQSCQLGFERACTSIRAVPGADPSDPSP